MNKNKHIQNYWMRFKVSTLAASVTSLILAGLPVQIQASDIDIYQAGGTGTTKIYMMLDKSGSMNHDTYMKQDYGNSFTTKGSWWEWWDTTTEVCSKGTTINSSLYNSLKVGEYNYTIKDTDMYCQVDLSKTFDTDDAGYKAKIKKLCVLQSGTTYNCYNRIVNLRKGLISLILDSTIGKDIQLGLGVYSGSKAENLQDFLSMDPDTTNKKTLINKIQKITANGGTPIATAYNFAGKVYIDTSGSSNTSESCTGNGIYFLTDGTPDGDSANFSYPSGLTKKTDKNLVGTGSYSSYWKEIGYYAQSIRAHNKKVKTATVGFGGGYLTSDDAIITQGEKKYFDCSKVGSASSNERNLCLWGSKTIPNGTGSEGGFGEGGFYTAQSADDLVASLKSFITETTVPIEGSTIGSSTIPVDALNTSQLQPFAYFPMFKPMIETEDQLWVGNLKKYNVINGSLYDITNKAVFKNSTDFNTSLKDYWLNSSVTHPDEVISYGGNLSQLLGTKMPKLDNSNNLVLQRNVFLNSDSSAGDLVSAESILKAGALADREYLYGLLGYSKLAVADLTALKTKSYNDQLAYLKMKDALKGYQLGSIIHSSPILLTQKGAIVADTGSLGSVDREDYVLFGTTQGVLHVVKSGTQNTQVIDGNGVDTGSGTEVFSFVPKEMLTKQKTGFFESMAMGKATKNNDDFYYGVDGPWTAHTVYEPNFYDAKVGGETVARDGLQVKANSNLSHQYVYGGLRMGGRSYYGLNLSDIEKPKLMFHIDPTNASSTNPISYMGQSWSKPTVAYIKWNGQRKLAMIVGGGYDAQYESPTFTNSTVNNVKGNGVYIFDAENGKLLWWGSASTTDKNGDKDGGASTEITDMVNSIPSRVKTADRDGDGLVDHIYVGDLGGKVFRIDLNQNHKADDVNNKFVLNAFTFADVAETGKNPPRFYEAPTFTMHTNEKGKKFAVISLASGDRSSPLKSESTAQDMILGFYDSGVTQSPSTKSATATLDNMNEIYKTGAATGKTAGWFYRLPKTDSNKYQTRGFSEGVALDGDLYYSVFDPSKTNNGSSSASTSCSGGIVGTSKAYKLCLPSGICGTDIKITEVGDLGAGIISLNVGPGITKGSRKLIFNKLPETCIDGKCTSNPIVEYQTTNKLLPTRWYDLTPYVGAK